MEKLLRNLERRFGHLAVSNIAFFVILPKVFFLFRLYGGAPPNQLEDESALLIPAVLDGEWIRLLTFVCVPPAQSILWVLIYFHLTYLYCSGLERAWGAFRLNVFVLLAYIFTVLGAFAASAAGQDALINFNLAEGTIFFAFAVLYPNFTLNLFFVLPVKVKWLALFGWAFAVFRFVENSWAGRITDIAVIMNYLLFFAGHHVAYVKNSLSARHRRNKWQRALSEAEDGRAADAREREEIEETRDDVR